MRTVEWSYKKIFWEVSVFNWLKNLHKMLFPFKQNKEYFKLSDIYFQPANMIFIRLEPALTWRESSLSWREPLVSGETDEPMEQTNVSTPSSLSTLTDFRWKNI